MPDFTKLKKTASKRRKLDEPPSREDTFGNLEQPEHAPAAPETKPKAKPKEKTPRTAYLSLKITPEHKKKIKRLAVEEGEREAGIVEKAIDLYYSKNPPKDRLS